jgi:hypothetical protein
MKKTNVYLCINKKVPNSNSFALVERIKRKGSLLYQLFPINHRTKYPIFFEKLLERIHNLKTNYKYNKIYSILPLARALARSRARALARSRARAECIKILN